MGAVKVSGMNSGMDTDAIVQALVEAQSKKVKTAKKEQIKLEWKQEAWKTLNSKMKKLFNNTVTNLRYASTFSKKATTATNTSAVSTITGDKAVNGTQKLKIIKQAKTGYLTGAQLSETKAYTAANTADEILAAKGGSVAGSGVINVTTGGKTTAIDVSGSTSISDVLTKLKEAGLNANFDEKNQRFFISAKESGEANDFTITASDANGQAVMDAFGISTSLAADTASMKEYTAYAGYYVAGDRAATLANMQSLMDADIASKVAAYVKSNEDAAKEIESLEEKIQAIKDKDTYDAGDTVDSLQASVDEKAATIEAKKEALKAEGITDEEKTALEEEIKTLEEEKTALEIKLTDAKNLQTYEEEITKLNAKIADNNTYIEQDANGDYVASTKLTEQVENAFYNKAEYAVNILEQYKNGTMTAGATRIAGQDAVIELNDAVFESSSNSFDINGLTITVLQETDEEITLTTQDDTDGIYDTVKSFLKEFNELAKEMDKLYGTAAAKDYEPLTDEEKEEMSESEIEKWEQKVKDGLLSRDSQLGSFSSAIYAVMQSGFEVNGNKMYLSSFGIATLGYFDSDDYEKHMYHIDGDEDDDATGSKADKLKSMIATDPSTVADFFAQLGNKLLNTWQEMSKSTEYSSYGSIYNDKQMKEQYSSYTSKIKDLEAKLTAAEDKWYNKFTAMEVAMAKLQSNQSAISSMLGM